MKKQESENVSLSFVESLKHQWMATVDALIDPLMIVRRDYTILKANKAMARLAGSDVKSIVGQKCFKALANQSTPCQGCLLQKAAETRQSESFELKRVRGSRYYEVTSQPLSEDSEKKGDLGGVVQIYRDRTEAQRMQEQLMQSEKLASIGLLAGGVAHEINNPLGGIMVFSQMLLRELDPKSPHYADVKEIEDAAQRCKSIVENLLDFARQKPEPQSNSSSDESINIVDAIRTALKFASVSLDKSPSISVTEDWGLKEAQILGDRNRLIQVFLNLIQNAFHAMPDGGELTLRSTLDPKGMHPITGQPGPIGIFSVSDTGCGIPQDKIKSMFTAR